MIRLEQAGVAVETVQNGRVERRTILHPITTLLDQHRIAVVGPNGSGKSTLLRLLNGLAQPTTGRVLVNDRDPATAGAQVRREVGFVFTDPLSQLVMATAVDDVELSLRRRITDRTERRRTALALLESHGLLDVAENSVHDLSGGERQLVALASVLAVEPRIVVADEPTTLLDLRNRHRVQAALLALPQHLVVATHDLDFAAACDRVLVIDEGRLVADGEPDEAISHYRARMA